MNATVVEKLREILLNLRVPPNYSTAIPLTSSAPLNPNNNVVYGERSLYPSEVRDSSSVVYGSEVDKHEGLLANSSSESDSLLKHLQELIHVLKMASAPSKNPSRPNDGAEMELNLTLEDITDLNNLMGDYHRDSVPLKHVAIIVSYLLIAFVSIVGNLLVVQLVIRSRRLHTLTHALLANLAVADLFMSTLNIPFSAARVILAEWPFGSFLCHAVPFVQVTSVYVTSITMAVIALDRYQVIMNPLGRRMKSSQGILLVLAIWSFSGLLSLPYALHHKVVTVLTVRVVNRCQAEFSSMQRRRWLTVATVFGQYFIPLGFTTASYVSIMFRLGLRSSAMGSTTPRQVAAQSKAKRKTIKMLVLTVIFFAVCWAPINAYHLLTHFSLVAHNSTAILICHLIAMSSTCYNPFIYCWLNEHFRREALKWLCCIRSRQHHRSPAGFPPSAGDTNGTLKRSERQAAAALNNSNHSAVSIPLFNLRPGSAASFNQPDQLHHHMKSMGNNGSHRAIGLEISSSSTSSYAAAVRIKKKKGKSNDGKREKVRRHKSAGAAVSSDDSVSNFPARANSVISCGIFTNNRNHSCSSLENCHDSGCGTAKAESPV